MERTFDTIYEETLSVVKSVNVPEEYRTMLLEALENARKDRDVNACSIVSLSAVMGEFKHECLTRFDTLGTAMLDVRERVSKLERAIKMNDKELYDIYDEVNRLLVNNEMEFDLPTVEFNLDIAKTLYYADDAKSLLLLKASLENLIEINERSKKND